jgi:hypothetical protein
MRKTEVINMFESLEQAGELHGLQNSEIVDMVCDILIDACGISATVEEASDVLYGTGLLPRVVEPGIRFMTDDDYEQAYNAFIAGLEKLSMKTGVVVNVVDGVRFYESSEARYISYSGDHSRGDIMPDIAR